MLYIMISLADPSIMSIHCMMISLAFNRSEFYSLDYLVISVKLVDLVMDSIWSQVITKSEYVYNINEG